MAGKANGTEATLQAALARIAELNRELGRDPAQDPVLAANQVPAPDPRDDLEGDPIQAATKSLIKYMKGRIGEIEGKKDRARDGLNSMIRIRDQAIKGGHEENAKSAQEYIDRDTPEVEAEEARYDAHIAALRGKIERLETDPASMFLPLGAVVRFTDASTYDNSLSFGHNPGKQYPLAGSIGVVSRLNDKSEFPIAVSLRKPFKTGYGDEFEPDYDRFPTFNVDPDKVEFVEFGMLPGGQPCESYGYVPTHERTGRKIIASDRDDEMIVEADGFFWRFCHVGDTTVEAIQAYDRIEEMSWVGEPLDLGNDDTASLKPF